MVSPGSPTRARWWTRTPARRWAGVVVVILVVLIWWWPGISGEPEDIDVRLVIGDELSVANQSIDRRLREQGFLLERTRAPEDWCEAVELLADEPRDDTRVVLWAATSADCPIDRAIDDLVAAADGRRLVVVDLPTDDGSVRAAFGGRDVRFVDAVRLLGEPGSTQDCLWWEECPTSGLVEPWIGDALGPIGGERLARMIVTEVL